MSNRWEALDPARPSEVHFVRRPPSTRIVVLLGAFDPPTNAHLAVIGAAASEERASGVLCLTKTLLARPTDELLPAVRRAGLLERVASDHNLGFALANRGRYVDVAEAFASDGFDASFVIGSDKLVQLEDPSFYEDGEAGVVRTFERARFVVVPRPDRTADRRELKWLSESIPGSATEVRRRLRSGEPIDDLVPRAVILALRGYTFR